MAAVSDGVRSDATVRRVRSSVTTGPCARPVVRPFFRRSQMPGAGPSTGGAHRPTSRRHQITPGRPARREQLAREVSLGRPGGVEWRGVTVAPGTGAANASRESKEYFTLSVRFLL